MGRGGEIDLYCIECYSTVLITIIQTIRLTNPDLVYCESTGNLNIAARESTYSLRHVVF